MITIKAAFTDRDTVLGLLGRVGENGTRQIEFDCAEILAEYPEAVIVCAVKRPGEENAYYAELEKEGSLRRLILRDIETAQAGTLKIELSALDGEKQRRTTVYTGGIISGIFATDEEPDDPEKDLIAYIAEAEIVKQEASDAAKDALAAAGRAADAASEIENMTANAVTLPPGEPATANYNAGVLTIGVPKGEAADAALDSYAESYNQLPRLSLTGDVTGMSKAEAKVLSYSYSTPDAQTTMSGYAKVKWQGSSSLAYAKKNYKITLYEDEECTTQQEMTVRNSWGAHSKYVLKADWVDHTHARNVAAAMLWADCVKTRSESGYSRDKLSAAPNYGAIDGFAVLLEINGHYAGLYMWTIPKEPWMFGMEGNAQAVVLAGEKHGDVTRFRAPAEEIGGDDPDWDYEVEPEDTSAVLENVNAIYAAANTEDDEAAKAALETCVDIESCIDYAIFMDVLGITDNMGKNMLLVSYDGAKWILSAYDLDTAFGNAWDGKSWYRPDDDSEGSAFSDSKLLMRVWQLYRAEYIQRRAWLMQNVLTPLRTAHYVDDLRAGMSDELLMGETQMYPDIPMARADGVQQINRYMQQRREHIERVTLYIDRTLTAATTYEWFGVLDARWAHIHADYPEGGIGEAQNVLAWVGNNALPYVWHTANAASCDITLELSHDLLRAQGAVKNGNAFWSSAVVDTLCIGACALGTTGTTGLPEGTHIRVWIHK